jgi:hypothetical protein
MEAIQLNPYIIRFKMDLNPVRSHLVREIEHLTFMNSQKVGG